MLGFFVALIALIVIACRCSGDDIQGSRFEVESKKMNNRKEEIGIKFCATPNEEEAAREYSWDEKNKEQICKDFAEDFDYVFGEGWEFDKDICPPPVPEEDQNPFCDYDNDYGKWVYHLVLASRGKIDKRLLGGPSKISIQKNKNRTAKDIKFAKCLQKRLRNLQEDLTLMVQENGENWYKVFIATNEYFDRYAVKLDKIKVR